MHLFLLQAFYNFVWMSIFSKYFAFSKYFPALLWVGGIILYWLVKVTAYAFYLRLTKLNKNHYCPKRVWICLLWLAAVSAAFTVTWWGKAVTVLPPVPTPLSCWQTLHGSFTCMHICTTLISARCLHKPEEGIGSLQLELQMVRSYLPDLCWVLWKSNKCP